MEGVVKRPPSVMKAKICLVGDEAVGKTSLVQRYVHGIFDQTYIRTLGAVPARKTVDLPDVGGRPIRLELTVLDIMGKLTFLQLFQEAYFRGARGIVAVADITRRATLRNLLVWIESVKETSGSLPTVIVVNKADLAPEFGAAEIEEVARATGSDYFLASAKSGVEVETAFRKLSTLIAEQSLGVH